MSDQPASMFVPPYYAAEDLRTLIRNHPFANVVTAAANGLFATSTPLVFETEAKDEKRLIGHIALRNAHSDQLVTVQPALAIFNGPNAYVSPRWYVDKPQVPTWNYLSAQVRGSLEPVMDGEGTRNILIRTITVMEKAAREPWRLEDAPAGMVDMLLPRIRAFRLHIGSLEGAAKLSQAHPAADRLRVMRGLLAESDASGREVARIMAQSYKPD